jgi:hypothetical protein
MNAELSPARRWAFRGHVILFVLAAVLAGLCVGGTWRPALAVAGVCWIVSGALALYARRALMRPGGMRGMDAERFAPHQRAGLEQAGSFFVGTMLLLWGAVVLWMGLRWLRLLSGG